MIHLSAVFAALSKGSSRLATGSVFGIFLFLGLMAVLPARAQTFDPFTVRGVSVDVTADTASAARKQALRNGEQLAYKRLLDRLTLASDREKLPGLSGAQITDIVQSLSVSGEKTSGVRYLARLDVQFRASDIRNLLRDYGVPYAETVSRPLLVLPVLEADGREVLFGGDNPWLNAWSDPGLPSGLVPVRIPLGDLEDMGLMTAERALRNDAVNFISLRERYGAEQTMVAVARLGREAVRGTPELTVETRRFGASGSARTQTHRFSPDGGETDRALLQRAARTIARNLADGWKNANLVDASQEAFLPTVIPVQNLQDWLDIKKRIEGVSLVREMQLILLARNRARVNLLYAGGEEQLTRALEQVGLTLYRSGFDAVVDRPGRPRYESPTPQLPVVNEGFGPLQPQPQPQLEFDPRGGEFLPPPGGQ